LVWRVPRSRWFRSSLKGRRSFDKRMKMKLKKKGLRGRFPGSQCSKM
jgi:hypothetical protein